MKSIVKRIVALLVALLSVGVLASCVKKENAAPNGMMIASAAGADYYLYVPTTWNLNTFYGISGAYRDPSAQSTVSVNRYSAAAFCTEEGADRNAAWWEQICLPLLRERALNGEVTIHEDDAHATVLGGADASYRHTSAVTDGKSLHFVQVVAERGGYFYLFTFTATDELYEFCIDDVEKMLKEFIFSDEPYVPEDYAWKPAKVTAPEGMKVASSDEVAYRFYVPKSWTVDYDRRIFAAYEPNDRTNVSVAPYWPSTDGMSIAEFFTMENDLMRQTADVENYTLISYESGENITLGGRPAARYEFTYTVGGNTYRYIQVIALYKGMFYTVTYTADEEHFAAHLDEWNAILQAFAFR